MSNMIELSYQQTLMDTDDQYNWMVHNNNNHNSSSVNVSRNDNFMELYGEPNAICTFEFILSHAATSTGMSTNNNQNQSMHYEKQQLINLVQNYNDGRNLTELAVEFAKSFVIYLYFIAFHQGKFGIINEYLFPDQIKQRKTAFVVLNGDKTICGPLFAHVLTGEQTVFVLGDMSVAFQVDKYIDNLNRTDPSLMSATPENPTSIVDQDMLVNGHSALVDGVNSEILDPSNNTMEVNTFDDQMRQPIIQTGSTPSTIDTVPSLVQGLDESGRENHENASSSNNLSDHQVHSNRVREADQSPAPTTTSSAAHISNTTQRSQTVPELSSTTTVFAEQHIVNQPKPGWNPRYPKDLVLVPKKPAKVITKARKQTNKKNKTTFIGILPGLGNQRSRIKMEVPPKGRQKMYQAISVRTIENQHHLSKVIVPEKTKVNKEWVNHQNNLNYLEFDECSLMHFFDPETQTIYMEITPREHNQGFKEVPVYMFNLYQNPRLTKQMIELQHLDQCKLAFWLCVKKEENYIPISRESLSNIITEKKKKKKNDPP